MKTVLCYGDSNVWGFTPGGGRHEWEIRWPGRLSAMLGDGYRVIEEGLNGRNSGIDDPLLAGRNGYEYLPIVLETHYPADIVVLMLGTNDLKCRFHRSIQDITNSMRRLIQVIQTYLPASSDLVLISPPPVQLSKDTEMNESFEGAIEKCKQLTDEYRELACESGCYFVDIKATHPNKAPFGRDNLVVAIFLLIQQLYGSAAFEGHLFRR